MTASTDPCIAERIDAITAYLPMFEVPEAIGKGAGGERLANGATQVPWFDYSPEALAFIRACASNGWVEPFDWRAWEIEADRYFKEPVRLEQASLDDLKKLLTLHIRRDRFFDGHLANMAQSGHIAAILRRLQTIRGTLP